LIDWFIYFWFSDWLFIIWFFKSLLSFEELDGKYWLSFYLLKKQENLLSDQPPPPHVLFTKILWSDSKWLLGFELLKGYQTKLVMPPVRFYCFKCAIYLCACLCVFIYPCIYLCYMTVSAYDLCMSNIILETFYCPFWRTWWEILTLILSLKKARKPFIWSIPATTRSFH
jgi:hypothetical protein